MPNIVDNYLKIDGPNVAAVRAHIADQTEDGIVRLIDFNKIIPMPLSLRTLPDSDTTKYMVNISTRLNKGESMDPEDRATASSSFDFTDQEMKQYNQHVRSIQNWTIEHWGTKWNAFNDELADGDNTIHFQTAWAPPKKVIGALSTQFPDHRFSLEFNDEDFNTGSVIFMAGQEIQNA